MTQYLGVAFVHTRLRQRLKVIQAMVTTFPFRASTVPTQFITAQGHRWPSWQSPMGCPMPTRPRLRNQFLCRFVGGSLLQQTAEDPTAEDVSCYLSTARVSKCGAKTEDWFYWFHTQGCGFQAVLLEIHVKLQIKSPAKLSSHCWLNQLVYQLRG